MSWVTQGHSAHSYVRFRQELLRLGALRLKFRPLTTMSANYIAVPGEAPVVAEFAATGARGLRIN